VSKPCAGHQAGSHAPLGRTLQQLPPGRVGSILERAWVPTQRGRTARGAHKQGMTLVTHREGTARGAHKQGAMLDASRGSTHWVPRRKMQYC